MWITILGALIHIWRPKSLVPLAFLFIDMAGDIFISQLSDFTFIRGRIFKD